MKPTYTTNDDPNVKRVIGIPIQWTLTAFNHIPVNYSDRPNMKDRTGIPSDIQIWHATRIVVLGRETKAVAILSH